MLMANGETHVTDSNSPELALVDPELAGVLRSILPEAGDCLEHPLESRLPERSVSHPQHREESEGGTISAQRRETPEVFVAEFTNGGSEGPTPVAIAGAEGALRSLVPAESVPPTIPPVVGHGVPRSRPTHSAQDSARRRALRGRWVNVVSWMAVLGVLGGSLLAFTSPSASLRPSLLDSGSSRSGPGPVAPRNDVPSAAQPSKSQASEIRWIGQPIRWTKMDGADLYNVVLVRSGRRIDNWAKSTTMKLRLRTAPPSPTGTKVEYVWYVYPLFRVPGGGFRFGPLVGEGSVVLPSGVRFAGDSGA
jgi:hypothetical protein